MQVASDGSEKDGAHASGWASHRFCAATLTPGFDVSSFIAELFAATFLIGRLRTWWQRLNSSGIHPRIQNGRPRRFILWCDCTSVIKVLNSRFFSLEWWQWQRDYRACVADLAALGCNFDIAWVPSHNKRSEWTPELNGTSAIVARQLNDAADAAARDRVMAYLANPGPRRNDDAALRWSTAALQLAADIEVAYRDWLADGFPLASLMPPPELH
jgi:hypothetical protein